MIIKSQHLSPEGKKIKTVVAKLQDLIKTYHLPAHQGQVVDIWG